MKKRMQRQRRVRKDEGTDQRQGSGPRGNVLGLDRCEVFELLQGSVNNLGLELGLLVAEQILEDEVGQRCGERHARWPGREMSRHTPQPGFVTLAGQKIGLVRPRIRYKDGRGEVALESYAQLQRADAMPQAALKRLVRGVSCRDYAGVVDLAREGFGISASSVSRSFVRASETDLKKLVERHFEDVRFAVIFIDGVVYAGETLLVALGVSTDGRKHILGLHQGATENAASCQALLVSLRERGVNTALPTLFILDGAKALASAVKSVWGSKALIQRCQVHKKRNVQQHLAERHWPELAERLRQAYGATTAEESLRLLKVTVAWLMRINPDAATSLREGMEETLTIVTLGTSSTLRRTLSTTNAIESALSITRTVTTRVKRWRDGDMRLRWCAAGLLRAENKFRRVKGFGELNQLLHAIEQHATITALDKKEKVA